MLNLIKAKLRLLVSKQLEISFANSVSFIHLFISNFLIDIYKATADVDAAKSLYAKYTAVSDEFVQLRNIVLAKKQPRKVFVQPFTKINKDGEVELVEFDASAEGMIKFFQTRFA